MTLQYLNQIRSIYSQATYKKRILQIRKYLRYKGLDWLDSVKIVSEPTYMPKRVTDADIQACLAYFENNLFETQAKALIYLGKSTGMRPSELYRLNLEDIDFENRSIEIHRTKTGNPRMVFFNNKAKRYLLKYCRNKPRRLRKLFGEYHCRRMFKDAPIKVSSLRKYFLQAWNKRGGQYLVGEILTGHSIRGNVTASHYVAFSLDELKEEYDRVMNTNKS